MQIELPADCGNAPRIGIVADFAVNWAKGDAEGVSAWLADTVSWSLVGQSVHSGPDSALEVKPPFSPQRVKLISIITHGRLASCDGYLEADGRRIEFSHVFRFASTSKTAKIAQMRSYCIDV